MNGTFAEDEHIESSGNPTLVFPNKIFGRTEEKELIQQAIDDFKYGRQISIHVSGAAGIGKSSFINSTLKTLSDYDFHYGKFEHYHQGVPYYGICQIFESIVRRQLSGDDEQTENWKLELQRRFSYNYEELKATVPSLTKFLRKPEFIREDYSPIDLKNRITTVLEDLIQFSLDMNEKSLIIHLDDLQWIDQESLDFLHSLMTKRLNNLLLIISNRIDENEESRTFLNFMDSMSKVVTLESIELRPLKKDAVREWLKETFPRHTSDLNELVDISFKYSSGNPYVLIEVLSNFNRQGKIQYNENSQGWSWNFSQAGLKKERSLEEILKEKLLKLSPTDQHILQLSTCFGSNLNIPLISRILDIHQETLRKAFKAAEEIGFLSPTAFSISRDEEEPINYEFTHNFLQKSVYHSLDTDERLKIHRKIANFYISQSVIGLDDRDLFDAVYHLNSSLEMDMTEEEKTMHAQLNLRATRKAKLAASFSLALEYIQYCMRHNMHNNWQGNYGFSSAVHLEGYQIARLNGNYQLAGELFDEGLKFSRPKELARLKLAKLILDIQFGELKASLETGISALRDLGTRVPRRAGKLHVGKELLRTKILMRGRDSESIYSLPEMQDEKTKLAFRIIFWMFRSAQFLNPELNGVLALKKMQLTLKKGSSGDAFTGLMAYGVIIGAGKDDYRTAYKFCDIGNRLAEKYRNESGEVDFGRAIYLAYREHLRETLIFYEIAKVKLLQKGDFVGAAEPTVNESITFLAAGYSLDEVEAKVKENMNYCADLHMRDFHEFQMVMLHQIQLLKEIQPSPDQRKKVEYILKTTQYSYTIAAHGVISMQMACFESKWKEVLTLADKLEKKIPFLTGLYIQTEYFFFKAIALLMDGNASKSGNQKSPHRKIKTILKKMYKWADSAPQNHLHKILMVESLLARSNGNLSEAIEHMKSASKIAHEELFIQNAALANRFLSVLFQENGQNEESEKAQKLSDELFAKWRAKS